MNCRTIENFLNTSVQVCYIYLTKISTCNSPKIICFLHSKVIVKYQQNIVLCRSMQFHQFLLLFVHIQHFLLNFHNKEIKQSTTCCWGEASSKHESSFISVTWEVEKADVLTWPHSLIFALATCLIATLPPSLLLTPAYTIPNPPLPRTGPTCDHNHQLNTIICWYRCVEYFIHEKSFTLYSFSNSSEAEVASFLLLSSIMLSSSSLKFASCSSLNISLVLCFSVLVSPFIMSWSHFLIQVKLLLKENVKDNEYILWI